MSVDICIQCSQGVAVRAHPAQFPQMTPLRKWIRTPPSQSRNKWLIPLEKIRVKPVGEAVG